MKINLAQITQLWVIQYLLHSTKMALMLLGDHCCCFGCQDEDSSKKGALYSADQQCLGLSHLLAVEALVEEQHHLQHGAGRIRRESVCCLDSDPQERERHFSSTFLIFDGPLSSPLCTASDSIPCSHELVPFLDCNVVLPPLGLFTLFEDMESPSLSLILTHMSTAHLQ